MKASGRSGRLRLIGSAPRGASGPAMTWATGSARWIAENAEPDSSATADPVIGGVDGVGGVEPKRLVGRERSGRAGDLADLDANGVAAGLGTLGDDGGCALGLVLQDAVVGDAVLQPRRRGRG